MHADAGDKVPDVFSVFNEENTKMTNKQFFFAVIHAVLDAPHELRQTKIVPQQTHPERR